MSSRVCTIALHTWIPLSTDRRTVDQKALNLGPVFFRISTVFLLLLRDAIVEQSDFSKLMNSAKRRGRNSCHSRAFSRLIDSLRKESDSSALEESLPSD